MNNEATTTNDPHDLLSAEADLDLWECDNCTELVDVETMTFVEIYPATMIDPAEHEAICEDCEDRRASYDPS